MKKYKILKFNSLPSTNLYAKEHFNDLKNNTVIVAKNQTNGRGRETRVWESNNNNIAMSILIKKIENNNISNITLVAGAAVNNALGKYINCQVKWPNDIIVNDKKICGILCEAVSSNKIDAIIVGIGINVNEDNFSDGLINKATSLKKELNKEFNLNKIIKKVIKEFDKLYCRFIKEDNEYINIIRDNFYLKNKMGYIENKKVMILDIDNDGKLIVDENGEIKKYISNEVTLTSFYKQ